MTEGKGTRNNLLICLVFVVLLLVIDQVTKIWVKMHEITSWFKIYFVENEGMAYGITIGSKLLLTLFRILAMSAGLYFLIRIIRTGRFSLPFYLCLSLVIAGPLLWRGIHLAPWVGGTAGLLGAGLWGLPTR